MSIRLMAAVFDYSRSRLADRLVLLVIADRSHDDGTGCFRARESIAQMAGVSPRQVTESVRRLKEMGELEVTLRPGQSNLYTVTLAGPATPPPVTLARTATPPSRVFQTGVAESSTNSSIDTSSDTGHPAASGGPDERIQKLVSGYVDDYRIERSGHSPSARWRGAAGKAVKTALQDGEDVEDIARCLGVVAHEGKNPSALPHVLSDYHANRPRRMQ